MATIERISGRDCMNAVKVSNKINEIITFLEENELLTKNEYENMLTMGVKK